MIHERHCDFHFTRESHWQWVETIALSFNLSPFDISPNSLMDLTVTEQQRAGNSQYNRICGLVNWFTNR
jgi:hypothetical protein